MYINVTCPGFSRSENGPQESLHTRVHVPVPDISCHAVPSIRSVPIPYPGPGGGYCIGPVYPSNDAGFAYNLSKITFVTTLVNLTGTFSYNSSQKGLEAVDYYIALGQILPNDKYGAYYIQPVIIFASDGNDSCLAWQVQAWGDDYGKVVEEYNTIGVITGGSGSSLHLNYIFNLTINATLNSQGQITQAYIYIANAKTGQVYYSQTIDLQYTIPDKQVFFEVEDPLSGTTPVSFPTIPSSNYVFANSYASNSSMIFEGGFH